MPEDLRKQTARALRDLHARERMRLGIYRHLSGAELRALREKKARQSALLRDAMRRRGMGPVWYARAFYLGGSLLGALTAFLPHRLAVKFEHTMERWMSLHYERYHKRLALQQKLRSMVEAMRMEELDLNEPAPDVLDLLEGAVTDEPARTLSVG